MKTKLMVVVALIVSVTAMAQKPVKDASKPEARGVERMKQELSLTDEQYASIKNIKSEYAKKRDSERKKYEQSRLEERKTMQSLRVEHEREIRKVLTPEQTKKLDEQKAQRAERYRKHNMEKRNHQGHWKKHDRNPDDKGERNKLKDKEKGE